MDVVKNYFMHKAFDGAKLESFGFKREGEKFTLSTPIMDGQFTLKISIVSDCATSEVIEVDTGERFALYSVADSVGAFVGQMRAEAEEVCKSIDEKCCYKEIFKCGQTKRVIEYARQKYGDEVEYLWDKFPYNGVLRRKDNAKWYAVILTVARGKIGLDGEGFAEVIDLRGDRDEIEEAVRSGIWLPAYHMNKTHWFTICLDDDFDDGQIFKMIDLSFELAKKK